MKRKDNTIGKLIRKYRNYHGLSRKALGEKMNLSDGMIEEYEYGKTIPPVERLKQLHKVLDIPFMEFFPDIIHTQGYISKFDEKLLKLGVLEIFEKHPEIADIFKAYNKNAKNLKDVDLAKLINKLASYSPDKKQTALNILMKGKI
jgi:transcriptional regulator with XRE-family HTH domain